MVILLFLEIFFLHKKKQLIDDIKKMKVRIDVSLSEWFIHFFYHINMFDIRWTLYQDFPEKGYIKII